MTGFDMQPGRQPPSNQELSPTQYEEHEHDLRDALTELAGLVAETHGLDGLMMQVAQCAVLAIPGVEGAGVTLMTPSGQPREVQTWAVTAPFVREIDLLQYETLSEGPCLTCMSTGRPAVSGSIEQDERWPRFGPRVRRFGVRSTLALPLILPGDPGHVVGAINTYSRTADAFGEHAVELAVQFARPAAVSVYNTQLLIDAQTAAEQLRTALRSRAVIDQAIGILRSRAGGSEAEQFEQLRQRSQHENIKVSALARRIVDEAVRRANSRHAGD